MILLMAALSLAAPIVGTLRMQDIPLEQIVKISCMGVRKLQTTFKEYHGCTLTDYVQQRRMSQAETLLANTDIPIGQVAQIVGYSKASRFSELFRKSTGILPSEFRKMTRKNERDGRDHTIDHAHLFQIKTSE